MYSGGIDYVTCNTCDTMYVNTYLWRETLILWLTDGVASKGVHTTMHTYRKYHNGTGGRILLLLCVATEILQQEHFPHTSILHM
jgi:hypothetical protein